MNCKGCEYWRYLSCRQFSKYYVKCCHFNLDEGRSRRKDGDVCFEYKPENPAKRIKRRREEFFLSVVTDGGRKEYDGYSDEDSSDKDRISQA